MSIKGYVSKTGMSVVFAFGDTTKTITFKKDRAYYTKNSDEQNAIEKSRFFKTGVIYTEEVQKAPDMEFISNGPAKAEFPDITDINEAVSILRKSPYSVHYSKLKDKESVKEQIAKNNVVFPNLDI
jgi:hypothetical protein